MHQPELTARPSWGRRLLGIEGLRGIAAMTVLVHHTANHLTSPGLFGEHGARLLTAFAHGLTLFFVLSGFLLFRPFASALLGATPAPRIGHYFTNRVLRIYPAYLVVFLVAALVMGSVYTKSVATAGEDAVGRITDPWTFVADLLLVQTYFPQTILTGLGVAWSLTAEVAFYIILPALFFLGMVIARRVHRVIAAFVPAVVMVAIGLITTAALASASRGMTLQQLEQFEWGNTWWAVLNRSVVAQADLFGYGMIAAIIVTLLHQRGLLRVAVWHRACLLTLALALGAGGALYGGHASTNIVGIACALLITAIVLPGHTRHEPSRLARILEWLPLRYLGLISYSIYLWHVPVIWWLRMHGVYDAHSIRGGLVSMLLVAAVTIVLASITYRFVERPAMSLKARTDRDITGHVARGARQ